MEIEKGNAFIVSDHMLAKNVAEHLDKKYPGYQRGKIYFALKRKHNEQG